MQKQLKWCLAGAFLLAALTVPALAHSHPGDPATTAPTTSSWAQAEVKKAQNLGLIPDWGPLEDYRTPITRKDFRMLAMRFVALQQNYDSMSFNGMIFYYCGEKNLEGQWKLAFSDGDLSDTAAYYLGVIQGRGDGTFDPNTPITRQEAAAIMARAYISCGGNLPKREAAPIYRDQSAISNWAIDAVVALNSWDVIKDMGDGFFSPQSHVTFEQSIVAFLYLYENTPISRENGNLSPLFTYEQGITFIEEDPNYSVDIRCKGAEATFIELSGNGLPHPFTAHYFVYHKGGIQLLDLGVHTVFSDAVTVENPRFSEDGNSFFCSATLTDDQISMDTKVLLYKKGTYHITIDVDTCQYSTQLEP